HSSSVALGSTVPTLQLAIGKTRAVRAWPQLRLCRSAPAGKPTAALFSSSFIYWGAPLSSANGVPLPRHVTTAFPRVRPLVLKRRAAAFDNPDWLFDLKYDGFRALFEIDSAGARLVSRNRNRFRHLDPLAATLAKRLGVTDAILDG